ncbi:hypothetical protein C1I93_16070 [Micromonospora endophytica]|uniref:DUF397 domain-containing protein n=1 Tax=Micromonospora endophytica TaxID=515350 RepID=A0A2W2C5Z9_9ACTN|nr:hypothetical protein C1I93_16070 [Micromonospora endophytica]RIW47414.1 DUF397 domain-containing protein [Micromonospora endophytica]
MLEHFAEQLRHLVKLGSGGACVEVADNLPDVVAVRDSKDPTGPTLTSPPPPGTVSSPTSLPAHERRVRILVRNCPSRGAFAPRSRVMHSQVPW